jgi:hypothetical protein
MSLSEPRNPAAEDTPSDEELSLWLYFSVNSVKNGKETRKGLSRMRGASH